MSPTGSLEGSPIPGASPSVSPSDIPVLKISPAEMRQLLSEFLRAQKTEARALEHRQDVELKDLKASQKVRLSEWKARMNDTRRKFFADHQGDSKTIQQFMHDRDDKYDAFVKMLDEERHARESDSKARMKSLQTDQADRLKEFRAYLSRGERPPRNLWP